METCVSVVFFICGTRADVNVFILKISFFRSLMAVTPCETHVSFSLSPTVHPPTNHNAACFSLCADFPLTCVHVFHCMFLIELTVACLLFFFRRGREECV